MPPADRQLPSAPRAAGWHDAGAFDPHYFDFYGLDLGQETFFVEHGGHRLAAQIFTPDVPSRGTAIVVHGYYDHVGIYGHLIRYLLARGFTVFAYDQEGHGLSTGHRASIASFDDYVDALHACLESVGDRLPEPWSLIGQSMGGSVAMEFLYREGVPDFARVVLLAPLVRPKGWPRNRWVFYAARTLGVRQVARGFAQNSNDAAFLEFLRADPLQPRVLPVPWVRAMASWMRRFEAYGRSAVKPLVVQGGQDGTVDAEYNLGVIERLFDFELLRIPEARHHLVNDAPPVREQIWRFLDDRL